MRAGVFLAVLAGLAACGPARAQLSIGLTTEIVEVDAGFAGAKIVLFGAVDGASSAQKAGDIVAVVRGPDVAFTLRAMRRTGPVWTPGPAIHIEDAPALYLTSSTRPLEAFTTPALRAELELGAASIDLSEKIGRSGLAGRSARGVHTAADFIDAEVRGGRYRDVAGGVSYKGGSLFAIDVDLPPDTPVGDYAVEVFLIRDDTLLAADTAALSVRKVGIERRIYDLAHQRPLGYGIVCVAMSLLAGWAGAAAFRK